MYHGTRKEKKVKTQQEFKQEEELAQKINSKLADFFIIRKKPFNDQQIPKYLDFTALIIQLCSDIPTIYNFRRQLLERLLKQTEGQPAKQGQHLALDLKLTAKLIKDDPKSYSLWSYRQWLVIKLFAINPKVVSEQKMLCKMLLMKDEKNFHVWNYRNWVNSIDMDIDEQIAFTEEKIKANPFNFSPYHFRSKYLASKYAAIQSALTTSQQLKSQIEIYGMPKEIFEKELETVKTAMFLNPNEEAPWTYYRWLLKRLLPILIVQEQKIQEYNNDGKDRSQNLKVVLNQRVHAFDQKYFSLHPEITKCYTEQKLSDVWVFDVSFCSEQNSEQTNQQQNSNIKSNSLLLTQGNMPKRVILDSQQNSKNLIEQVRSIYKTETSFIEEILQEEKQCRFAWFQLLENLKNQLLLGCPQQQKDRILALGQNAFSTRLDKEEKTKQYIDRIKEFWFSDILRKD